MIRQSSTVWPFSSPLVLVVNELLLIILLQVPQTHQLTNLQCSYPLLPSKTHLWDCSGTTLLLYYEKAHYAYRTVDQYHCSAPCLQKHMARHAINELKAKSWTGNKSMMGQRSVDSRCNMKQ